MATHRILYIASILFFEVCLFSFSLSGQEDVAVEFSFSKPNTFVCEIRNMTDSNMDIWFDIPDIPSFSVSHACFDVITGLNDTVRHEFYPLKN